MTKNATPATTIENTTMRCAVCLGTLTFGRLDTDCREFVHRGTATVAAK